MFKSVHNEDFHVEISNLVEDNIIENHPLRFIILAGYMTILLSLLTRYSIRITARCLNNGSDYLSILICRLLPPFILLFPTGMFEPLQFPCRKQLNPSGDCNLFFKYHSYPPVPLFFCSSSFIFINGFKISIGTGKMVVELFSVAISRNV